MEHGVKIEAQNQLRIKPSFALAWQLKKLITLIFRVHEKSFKFKIFAAKRILGFASGAK
jgi:hypothetical protein